MRCGATRSGPSSLTWGCGPRLKSVPGIITGEVLAAYLSAYGQVEEFNLLRSPAGTAYRDYAFRLCLTRDGFKAIPETLVCGDWQMIVMVEGRRPRCWGCKQIGHIAKFCSQRPEGGEGAAKKICPEQPKAGPSSRLQKQQLRPPPPSFLLKSYNPHNPLIKILLPMSQ